MKRNILLLSSIIIFMSQVFCVVHAQEQPVIRDSIYSNILQEKRAIEIKLPDAYKAESTNKYDVIYVTDGEWAMTPFSFIYKWAEDEDFVPPAIIVSIPNRYIEERNQRDRDFLPVHVPHTEIYGGDFSGIPKENNGVLGIDLEWDMKNQFYKIAKIYRGQNWHSGRISPLTLPGLNIKEGDYLQSIDGTVLKEDINPYALLVIKADTIVTLSIHSKPTFKDSKEVKLKPIPISENDVNFLRYNDWVWSNIEKVDKATDRKVGYIHIPDTFFEGLEFFFRYFYPQVHKQALIVDIRFNSGGFPPFYMIERMNGKLYFTSQLPFGRVSTPGFHGPEICITNQWAEAGGDMFVSIFRQSNSGLTIGNRTCGTLAATGARQLLDGGVVIFPAIGGIVDQNSQKVIENIGVSPDVEVINRPDDLTHGKDLQLERSIEEIMKKL